MSWPRIGNLRRRGRVPRPQLLALVVLAGARVEVAATTSGGLLVTEVGAGGPAAKAGIRAGELITAVDGAATPDPATLADVLAGLDPGQAVTVTIARHDGPRQTLRVALGQLPG